MPTSTMPLGQLEIFKQGANWFRAARSRSTSGFKSPSSAARSALKKAGDQL
jgi:hypothetical protein